MLVLQDAGHILASCTTGCRDEGFPAEFILDYLEVIGLCTV